MRLLLVVVSVALVGAGMSDGHLSARADTTGMLLTYEYVGQSPPPDYCYHEDSVQVRNYSGTLAAGESFTVTARVCTTDETAGGGGNTGLFYKATYSRGQSVDLHIVFPDGTVREAHPVSGYYASVGCVVPYFDTNDHGRGPIPGGIYQIVLTNTGSKAISVRNPLSEAVWARPGDIAFQTTYCPVEDQNIGPPF